jgi:hypothetical protein
MTFRQQDNLSTWQFASWQFANMTFCQNYNLPTWQFTNMTFHQHDISPTWHFANLQFANMTIHQLTICQHDISPTWQFANMTIHQHDISSTWHFNTIQFYNMGIGSGCACSLLWWSWWLKPRCSSSFVRGIHPLKSQDPGMPGSLFIRYQPFSGLGIVRPQNRVSLGWMRTCWLKPSPILASQ